MALVRAFISFDFDHDEDLKNLLVGQAKHPDTPFAIADFSLKQALSGDWMEKVRTRIRGVDQVAVVCGEWTHSATGVAAELTIAREEKKPCFLLKGRKDKTCRAPTSALATDKLYDWTWDNLKLLFAGKR